MLVITTVNVIVMDHRFLQVYWNEWVRVERQAGRSKTLVCCRNAGWHMANWIVWLSRCRMGPCWSVLHLQPLSTAQQGWFTSVLPEHLCMTRVEYCCTAACPHVLFRVCNLFHISTVHVTLWIHLFFCCSCLRGCVIFLYPCSSFSKHMIIRQIPWKGTFAIETVYCNSASERHKGKTVFNTQGNDEELSLVQFLLWKQSLGWVAQSETFLDALDRRVVTNTSYEESQDKTNKSFFHC